MPAQTRSADENSSAFLLSLAIHFGLITAIVIPYIWQQFFDRKLENVEVEVFATPTQVAPTSSLQLNQPKPAPPSPTPIKKETGVFGVSRKALTDSSNSSDAVAVKLGNTITKENDDLKLKDSDPDSLPIPADEYLVTSMPKILREHRAEYPLEAKKAGVEGPVIMDVLIDKQGRVRKVNLISGPGYGLNEAALSALEKFEFSPARIKDETVAVRIRYTYRFVLENR